MRVMLNLVCSECGRKNYTTTKNKQKHPDKLSYRKYCPFCRKHTIHKETK